MCLAKARPGTYSLVTRFLQQNEASYCRYLQVIQSVQPCPQDSSPSANLYEYILSTKKLGSVPFATMNKLKGKHITQATFKNVAHISLVQWCCLGNRLYNSYIPPWGVVFHIGVRLRPIPMCKWPTPQGGILLVHVNRAKKCNSSLIGWKTDCQRCKVL